MEARKYEIENYIGDWHWNEQSHALAFEMGTFLYSFMDYLQESNLAAATIQKHVNNTWCIGYLTCHYGYYDTFSPDIFSSPPFYEIEFKRKISDTPNALRSYKSSCNKLAKYVREKGWETLPEYDFEMPEEMEDLYIGLELLESKALRRGDKKEIISFQRIIDTLRENFVRDLRDVNGREEFIERMQCCYDTLQSLTHQLKALDTSDNYFRTKIRSSLSKDVPEMQRRIAFFLMNV